MKLSFARLNQAAVRASSWSCAARRAWLRRLDLPPPRQRRLLRPRRRLPLPARQGQLDRGRHLGDPAQHRRRAGARPARRAPRRQGRALEGPAPMTADLDLLYTEVEDDLRATVRGLLADRCEPRRGAPRCTTATGRVVDRRSGRRSPVDLGLAGLLVPEEHGGAGASAREAAVVLEELGRARRPGAVPHQRGDRHHGAARRRRRARCWASSRPASAPRRCWCRCRPRRTGRWPTVRPAPDGRSPARSPVSRAPSRPTCCWSRPTTARRTGAVRGARRGPADRAPVVSLDMTRQLADVTLDGVPAERSPASTPAAPSAGRWRPARRCWPPSSSASPLVPGDDGRLPQGAHAVRPRRRRLPGDQAPAGRPLAGRRVRERGRRHAAGHRGRRRRRRRRWPPRSPRPTAATWRCTRPRRRCSCTAASG